MSYVENAILDSLFYPEKLDHRKRVHKFVAKARDIHRWGPKKLTASHAFWETFEKEAMDVHQCPLCGKELNWGKAKYSNGRKRDLDKPSFDVIDPKLPTLENNCHIICWACNRSKSDMTIEEYITHCRQVAKRQIEKGAT